MRPARSSSTISETGEMADSGTEEATFVFDQTWLGLGQAGVNTYYRILAAPSPESPFYPPSETMQTLTALTKLSCTKIRFVLTDIDDTVTTEGRLTGEAYMALERLSDAGLVVIPITGRPAGWCDHIARMWPVFGVVGENGAFYLRYDRQARRMLGHYWASEAHRAENRQKLNTLSSSILKEVPGSALASDQAYRQADLAVDFCEDVEPLTEADVQKSSRCFTSQVLRPKSARFTSMAGLVSTTSSR